MEEKEEGKVVEEKKEEDGRRGVEEVGVYLGRRRNMAAAALRSNGDDSGVVKQWR